MTPAPARQRKPAITMTRGDHERLTRLAEAAAARGSAVADGLLAELDRARLVDDRALRGDVVRMGSTLRYTTETGDDRTVTLVFPGEADIEQGRISVMTPIGTALIGLSAGQSIDWTARDGRTHRLTVASVGAAEPAPGGLAHAS